MFRAMRLHHAEPALVDELEEPARAGGRGFRLRIEAAFGLRLVQQIGEIHARPLRRPADRGADRVHGLSCEARCDAWLVQEGFPGEYWPEDERAWLRIC
jgi:hypothetical protein